MEEYEQLRQEFRNISKQYWKQTKKPKMCEKCFSKVDMRLHHKIPLKTGGTNDYENLIPLCEECHWEFHRHFEAVKSHDYFMGTPKYTELIGLWEVLNDPLVDSLSMKEFKELIYTGLDLKRDVQKSFNEEEIEADNKQLK
ncbi:HNH endonuclease [Bacillus cereus group sp. BfR-BA-01445]|uniref:HNH endonuclease n=1 Tax=Bacillus cereus group sp. BfR-BA-01445 TaxID=2920349 RepID=UPI001F55C3E3|nr:HNH endonuclease signature motif containing protein [Bacillus cereus group sp. BfR-BA-01445]